MLISVMKHEGKGFAQCDKCEDWAPLIWDEELERQTFTCCDHTISLDTKSVREQEEERDGEDF